MLRRFVGNNAITFAHNVKTIGSQILESLLCAIGPQNLSAVEMLMSAEPKMYPQIVLRKIASTAENFTRLDQISCDCSQTGIQRQTIALYALQLKTDPMIRRTPFRAQNHRLSDQVFYHCLEPAIIEEIADSEPSAYLLCLHSPSNTSADVGKCSVALIQEQKLGLEIRGGSGQTIDLRIDMSVDHKEILPAIIGQINKGISPTHISLRAPCNPGKD